MDSPLSQRLERDRRSCLSRTFLAEDALRVDGRRFFFIVREVELGLVVAAAFDDRIDDVRLAALLYLLANEIPHLVERSSGTRRVTIGVRPGGSSSRMLTSRSP